MTPFDHVLRDSMPAVVYLSPQKKVLLTAFLVGLMH